MPDMLTIENGPTVELRGLPVQGTSHRVLLGQVAATGEQVVVKLEHTAGALENERAALSLLNAQRAPVPRLLAAGTALVRGTRFSCIVTERRRGVSPTTPAGWMRMGSAHAMINSLPRPGDGLMVLDAAAFTHQHAQRAAELGDRLAPLARSVTDWDQLLLPQFSASAPLALTHGDPGPGNFLDDGDEGTIIDWEEAHVAPRGLDLARLVFIALLGAGPAGYRATDRDACARAAADGYLRAQPDAWQPSRPESRWWTAVAGIQFIHRRWKLHGRPGPWEEATAVLHRALTADVPFSVGR